MTILEKVGDNESPAYTRRPEQSWADLRGQAGSRTSGGALTGGRLRWARGSKDRKAITSACTFRTSSSIARESQGIREGARLRDARARHSSAIRRPRTRRHRSAPEQPGDRLSRDRRCFTGRPRCFFVRCASGEDRWPVSPEHADGGRQHRAAVSGHRRGRQGHPVSTPRRCDHREATRAQPGGRLRAAEAGLREQHRRAHRPDDFIASLRRARRRGRRRAGHPRRAAAEGPRARCDDRCVRGRAAQGGRQPRPCPPGSVEQHHRAAGAGRVECGR